MEIPRTRCVFHTEFLAHGNSKGEARGRRKYKNSSIKRVVRNVKERNVGTKMKNPRQSLTIAHDLTIELPEGRESPYHRLAYLTNLTYSLIYGPWGQIRLNYPNLKIESNIYAYVRLDSNINIKCMYTTNRRL